MRLLNTTTLEFKEFLGSNIPPYAILSHVWSGEEISHADFLAERGKDSSGYRKILKLCELARSEAVVSAMSLERWPTDYRGEPLDWCWMDACCIDKRSSAELTEAINSMYEWYKRSEICLVFLPDVHPQGDGQTTFDRMRALNRAPFLEEELFRSIWFARGWTLQELIAPKLRLFLNTSYEIIGLLGPQDPRLLHVVEKVTRIDASVLTGGLKDEGSLCVARIMSWAARRRTTRAEDISYCLLGLFGVHIPLQYGEGAARAFFRLQEEIIRRRRDDSIFAWGASNHINTNRRTAGRRTTGLFAESPSDFGDCVSMERRSSTVFCTITQRGIEFPVEMPNRIRPKNQVDWLFVLPLSCFLSPADGMSSSKTYQCCLKLKIFPLLNDEIDGAKGAWRYGDPFWIPCEGFTIEKRLLRSVQKQILGWARPDLLDLSEAEGFQYSSIYRHDGAALSLRLLKAPLGKIINYVRPSKVVRLFVPHGRLFVPHAT